VLFELNVQARVSARKPYKNRQPNTRLPMENTFSCLNLKQCYDLLVCLLACLSCLCAVVSAPLSETWVPASVVNIEKGNKKLYAEEEKLDRRNVLLFSRLLFYSFFPLLARLGSFPS
jgi:hypothetical protein